MTDTATKKPNTAISPANKFNDVTQVCGECGEKAKSINGIPVCYKTGGDCTFSNQVKANMKKK